MTVPVRWKRSSFTAQQANCVEVANTLGAVRDSKDPNGPVLAIKLGGFISAVKLGRFDR